MHAWRNALQSVVLLGVMGGFLALLGWLLWGPPGIMVLVSVGVAAVLLNPALSPRIIMRMYGAKELHDEQVPALADALELLRRRAGLPQSPRLFWLPSSMLNAFAVGTRHQSAIAVSDGLLRQLELRELLAVLAHEVSHVRHHDLWVMNLADLISRATSFLSLFGQLLLLLSLPAMLIYDVGIPWFAILLLIIAPNLSALAQLALSRTREYAADLGAAELTGDPQAMISALARIENMQGGWLERIFLPGRRVPEPSLLRTHPKTSDRIARLQALIPERRWRPLAAGWEGPPHRRLVHLERSRRPRWHLNGLWY